MRFTQCGLLYLAAFLMTIPVGRAHAADEAGIDWRTDPVEAVADAARDHKPILVQVGAPWCGHCRRMFQQTYRHPRIIRDINGYFVPIYIDADANPELVRKLGVTSYPTTIFASSDRKVLGRLVGFRSAAQLGPTLLAVSHNEAKQHLANSSRNPQ